MPGQEIGYFCSLKANPKTPQNRKPQMPSLAGQAIALDRMSRGVSIALSRASSGPEQFILFISPPPSLSLSLSLSLCWSIFQVGCALLSAEICSSRRLAFQNVHAAHTAIGSVRRFLRLILSRTDPYLQ